MAPKIFPTMYYNGRTKDKKSLRISINKRYLSVETKCPINSSMNTSSSKSLSTSNSLATEAVSFIDWRSIRKIQFKQHRMKIIPTTHRYPKIKAYFDAKVLKFLRKSCKKLGYLKAAKRFNWPLGSHTYRPCIVKREHSASCVSSSTDMSTSLSSTTASSIRTSLSISTTSSLKSNTNQRLIESTSKSQIEMNQSNQDIYRSKSDSINSTTKFNQEDVDFDLNMNSLSKSNYDSGSISDDWKEYLNIDSSDNPSLQAIEDINPIDESQQNNEFYLDNRLNQIENEQQQRCDLRYQILSAKLETLYRYVRDAMNSVINNEINNYDNQYYDYSIASSSSSTNVSCNKRLNIHSQTRADDDQYFIIAKRKRTST